MSFLGRKHTEESKRKISESRKGRQRLNFDQNGKKNPSWKGGITRNKGRIYVLNHNHPYADHYGYVPRSRLVMEKMLDRFLDPEETVHHINGIKDDDRPENLKLFQSRGEHIALHNHINKKGIHWKKRRQIDETTD